MTPTKPTKKEIDFFIFEWDTVHQIEMQVQDILSKYKNAQWFKYLWKLSVVPTQVSERNIPHTEMKYFYEITLEYYE
jgi:hypothetical protein